MKREPHSLVLLRHTNPMRVDAAAVRRPQAKALFEQIIAEPRVPRRGRRSFRHYAGVLGLRARLAVGGAGISAVVAAVVVAVFSGSAAAPAFAGWTARPTTAVRQQITAVTHRCGLASPTLVESRGPYIAAVFTSRSGGSACVEGPSTSFVASIGGAQAANNSIPADQIKTAVATGADSEGHAFVLIAGRVGSAVRSVVIHRSNNANVRATVKNGWYLAWWPAGAHATNATVKTASGARNVALPSIATSSPSCTGHGYAACASVQSGSNGPGSAGVPSAPPLINGPLASPFDRTLLFNVYNASRVLVCFQPPASKTAALRPGGPTGPCTPATRLTRLPASYPVQRNLLEVFPNSVWQVKLPGGLSTQIDRPILVIAFSTSGRTNTRTEITLGHIPRVGTGTQRRNTRPAR